MGSSGGEWGQFIIQHNDLFIMHSTYSAGYLVWNFQKRKRPEKLKSTTATSDKFKLKVCTWFFNIFGIGWLCV